MFDSLKSGDVISFNTTYHELLGNPEQVTLSAFCNYEIAVKLDPSLPNTINRVIMHDQSNDYDPNSRQYLAYTGKNGMRVLDVTWIIESSIVRPESVTTKLTLHNVTLSKSNTIVQILRNLHIDFTME